MLHDELLEKINVFIAEYCDQTKCTTCSPYKALRAVVELHKPVFYPDKIESPVWCNQCAEGRGYAKYPCPTIQAIEKELV